MRPPGDLVPRGPGGVSGLVRVATAVGLMCRLMLALVQVLAKSSVSEQRSAGSCLAPDDGDACQPTAVRKSSSALPGDDSAAWAQLLASPTPLFFPASASSSTDGQQAELLAVGRAEGRLGARHVRVGVLISSPALFCRLGQALRRQPGDRRGPPWRHEHHQACPAG